MSDKGAKEVDFTFLHGYAAADEAFVREVLRLFVEDADPQALQPQSDWRAAAHKLKGAARAVGARRLGDLCERAEADGEAVLPQVREALTAALAEIEAYLAG